MGKIGERAEGGAGDDSGEAASATIATGIDVADGGGAFGGSVEMGAGGGGKFTTFKCAEEDPGGDHVREEEIGRFTGGRAVFVEALERRDVGGCQAAGTGGIDPAGTVTGPDHAPHGVAFGNDRVALDGGQRIGLELEVDGPIDMGEGFGDAGGAHRKEDTGAEVAIDEREIGGEPEGLGLGVGEEVAEGVDAPGGVSREDAANGSDVGNWGHKTAGPRAYAAVLREMN